MTPDIHLKRIYDEPADDDGLRVLVDRLWPRGITRDAAALHHWSKDLAPSPDLRTWFDHQPTRFARFTQQYRAELAEPEPAAAAHALLARARAPTPPALTLVYAAKDPTHNHARVLRDHLLALADPDA